MKKQEVKVSENLTTENTDDKNKEQVVQDGFSKLSAHNLKNVPSLRIEEEQMLLEDCDLEAIDKWSKTKLFLDIAQDLQKSSKHYITPMEAFKKMHLEMEDDQSDAVQNFLVAAKKYADVHEGSIDDLELHATQTKEALLRLAEKAYQTAIESITSPLELLTCATEIATELDDQEWASGLFYEAVKWMENLDTLDDMSIVQVIHSLSSRYIKLAPELIKDVLEIVLKHTNNTVHLERCELLIKSELGDDEWADEISKRAKLVA